MRHLHPTDIAGALRRGKSVEQFLGKVIVAGEPGIRYLELRPVPNGLELWVHDVEDRGDLDFCDIGEFGSLGDEKYDPEEQFAELGPALEYCNQRFGASNSRWVNVTIAGDDYRDFVLAGRPDSWQRT